MTVFWRSKTGFARASQDSRRRYLDIAAMTNSLIPTGVRYHAQYANGPLPLALAQTRMMFWAGAELKPNVGIITAYNDMLSAHQPFETYPQIIKAAAREVGATAQVASGVPAMCDGVTPQTGNGTVTNEPGRHRHGNRCRSVSWGV